MKQNNKRSEFIFIVLAILFSLSAFMLLHEFFSRDLNNFTLEILSVV